jgi:hypothetical protein
MKTMNRSPFGNDRRAVRRTGAAVLVGLLTTSLAAAQEPVADAAGSAPPAVASPSPATVADDGRPTEVSASGDAAPATPAPTEESAAAGADVTAPLVASTATVAPPPPPATGTESTVADAAAPPRRLGVNLTAELGFLAVLHHTIQFSNYGSRVDYVQEGGQDVLFPFTRLGAELRLRERTAITALYQPLRLVTHEVATRDLVVDDTVFAEGTPMTFTYGFPFWRVDVARDVLASPRHDLWLGGGLQIRNATLEFASSDGEQLVSQRNVGPVPLLRVAARTTFASGRFLEGEADGFYAPIKYINGGSTDVEGAILDASVRGGTPLGDDAELFLNLRYLGGGGEGTSNDDGPGDGYTSNWLHVFTVSLGARFRAL